MSKAPAIVDQARRLCESLRGLPADDAARALEQIATTAQAVQAQVLAEAERAGELKDSGCRSVRSYVQTILRRGVNDAAQVATVARHLSAFPQLAAAYAAGRVHTPNMRTIMAHVKPCGLAALQAHEDLLAPLATKVGPKELARFCQRIAEINHPDRDEKKAKALGLRNVKIVRVGDLARLDAMLDPAVADQLKATLAAMAEAARADDLKAAREAQAARAAADGDDGDGSNGARGTPELRSHGERMADALEEILRTGMAGADLPATRGRARPHATVTVQLETLLGMGLGPGERGVAWLHRFGIVPGPTAARLCCDALVRLIVQHGDRVLNVGRLHRTVTARQHAALAARYRTCVVPGCQIPFADCEINHLWWWALLGPTDLDLQVPLCGAHHRWLHDGGYAITREDGRLVFRDPRGRIIANPTDALAAQLDLLHEQLRQQAPRAGPECEDSPGGTGHQPPRRADDIMTNTDGWPDSPYQHGTWGWTGHNPGPPPGHAPPQDPEAS